jgi:hypothetical protein
MTKIIKKTAISVWVIWLLSHWDLFGIWSLVIGI